MKIVVVSDLPQFVTGGAEMQAARLIGAWLEQGHDVVCLGRRMGRDPVSLGGRPLRTHRIWTTSLFGRWGRGVSYFLSLSLLLLRYRAWSDVIYTRFLGDAAITASVLKLSGMLRTPLIATPANVRGTGDTDFLKKLPFARALIALLDRQCDAINLIAPEMESDLIAAGFRGKNFSYIPNGILIKPLRRTAIASDRIRFVGVGRLSPQKGYDVLLRAVARIPNREPCIVIAGDGPERRRLIDLANELNVANSVQWLGELSQDHIAVELSNSHVFILPSRYEGLSNAGLEAMERGLPLIVTNCGGLDHYIDSSSGWVVTADDSEALAQSIVEAMDAGTQKLYDMGMQARACVEREFDIETVAARYVELFAKCMVNNSRHKKNGYL